MLRHILTAAALPTFAPASTSSRMPNGVIAAANAAAPAPPSSIGTLWPYGSTGAITAASTKLAPLALIDAVDLDCFSAGDTEFRSA